MKIVLFIFAGRQVNLEVQRPYLDRLLRDYPEMELHLWDLTRTSADQSYVRGLEGAHAGRVRVLTHLHPGFPLRCTQPPGLQQRRRGRWNRCMCMVHKPPYEQPYVWYATQPEYADTVFVKMDDDVLFLETETFGDLIDPLAQYPNRVISANVINNAVCAKYESGFWQGFYGECGDPRDAKNDKAWWALHTEKQFAFASHQWFLRNWGHLIGEGPYYIRTRPGEAISINCIAFTHQTMKRLANSFRFSRRLGDEGVVDSMLPWIATSFRAAHLTFGPQDATMTVDELTDLRMEYALLSEEYLDDSAVGELV